MGKQIVKRFMAALKRHRKRSTTLPRVTAKGKRYLEAAEHNGGGGGLTKDGIIGGGGSEEGGAVKSPLMLPIKGLLGGPTPFNLEQPRK